MERTEQIVNEWKNEKPKQLVESKQVNLLRRYIEMTVKRFNHGLIITGRAGLGKTYTTINILKELKANFKYKSGYITALGLYKFLYRHRADNILLDDLEGLTGNENSIALLKTALWEANGKRIISYETTSKQLEDTPTSFEFTGTIIILANEIKSSKNENFKALLSRVINFELSFKHSEILIICHKILRQRDLTTEQIKVIKDILENEIEVSTSFNLRLLDRLINIVKFDLSKAKELFLSSLKNDKDLTLVYTLMKRKELTVKQQCNLFSSKTGKSRRTFYRIKGKIKEVI